jgi:Trk K+ transport system NAD-binding subunit
MVGKPVKTFGEPGKVLVAAVDRGGTGFIPDERSTFQEGDVAHVIVAQDALDLVDQLLEPLAEE